jgi:hypothetical protein
MVSLRQAGLYTQTLLSLPQTPKFLGIYHRICNETAASVSVRLIGGGVGIQLKERIHFYLFA